MSQRKLIQTRSPCLHIQCVAAPALRPRPLPQDGSAYVYDDASEASAYAVVHGLGTRGTDVGHHRAAALRVAARVTRALVLNAARIPAASEEAPKEAMDRRLQGILSNSLEGVEAGAVESQQAQQSKPFALAGFFSVPGRALSALFALGPISITVAFGELRERVASASGAADALVAKCLWVDGDWAWIRGSVVLVTSAPHAVSATSEGSTMGDAVSPPIALEWPEFLIQRNARG